MKTIVIPVTKEIKEELQKLKHPGQAYWGIVKELIDLYKEKHDELSV